MESLEEAVKNHKFVKSHARTNIGGPLKVYGKSKWIAPGHGHFSNTVRSGPIIEEVHKTLGTFVNNACLNLNVTTEPHMDKHNGGPSYLYYFGDFEGGELCLETGESISGKGKWLGPYALNKIKHWNLPHTGTKYAIIAW